MPAIREKAQWAINRMNRHCSFVERIVAYSLLIKQYIKDPVEKELAFDATNTMPAMREKSQLATRWMNRDCSFAERIVAFAAVEGVLIQRAMGP